MKYLLYIFSLAFVLSACSTEQKAPNLFGGADRNNAYDDQGDFYHSFFKVDSPKGVGVKGALVPPLSLDADRTAVASSDGKIVVLAKSTLEWMYKIESNQYVVAAMSGDLKGNIYAITNDGNMISLSSEGKLNWTIKLVPEVKIFDVFSDLCTVEDGIIAAVSNGVIKKISFEGKVLWTKNTDLAPGKTIAEDRNKNIVLTLSHNQFGKSDSLAYVSADGKNLWQIGLPNERIIRRPAIKNANIYFATVKSIENNRQYLINKIDSTGKIIWQKELPVMPRSIAIDDKEIVYVSGYTAGVGEPYSGLYAFKPDGEQLWKLYFDMAIPTSIMVGQYTVAFVGKKMNTSGLFFVHKDRGVLYKRLSMTNFPLFNLEPSVSIVGSIIFASSEELALIRSEEAQLNKMLMW